jgi:hypothetical protein
MYALLLYLHHAYFGETLGYSVNHRVCNIEVSYHSFFDFGGYIAVSFAHLNTVCLTLYVQKSVVSLVHCKKKKKKKKKN